MNTCKYNKLIYSMKYLSCVQVQNYIYYKINTKCHRIYSSRVVNFMHMLGMDL